jgi:SSS family solute:Na+ symporter
MNPWALLVGWAAGMSAGTYMAVSLGLKSSVYPLHLFGGTYAMYAAIPALLLNLAVSCCVTLTLRATGLGERPEVYGADRTAHDAYAD